MKYILTVNVNTHTLTYPVHLSHVQLLLVSAFGFVF